MEQSGLCPVVVMIIHCILDALNNRSQAIFLFNGCVVNQVLKTRFDCVVPSFVTVNHTFTLRSGGKIWGNVCVCVTRVHTAYLTDEITSSTVSEESK